MTFTNSNIFLKHPRRHKDEKTGKNISRIVDAEEEELGYRDKSQLAAIPDDSHPVCVPDSVQVLSDVWYADRIP